MPQAQARSQARKQPQGTKVVEEVVGTKAAKLLGQSQARKAQPTPASLGVGSVQGKVQAKQPTSDKEETIAVPSAKLMDGVMDGVWWLE